MATAGGDGSGEFSSPLSVVCTYWKEFDLESMRNKLDDVGLKIAELQEEAVQNRKKLSDSTRKLKRDDASCITPGVGALLRQYQDEIDRLTKRAKHSESAFLEVYQKLFDAPDPAPLLQAAFVTATRAAELEAQYTKVSQELSEYKAEAQQIKNQDLTIRKMEEKIRHLEAQVEERERQVVEAKQAAVAEADAAAMAVMQAREQQLAAMLAEAQSALASAQEERAARENMLFALQSRGEEEHASRQRELDLASQELERAQDRLRALETEKQQLVHRLETRKEAHPAAGEVMGAMPGAPGVEESLRTELSTQRELVGRLRGEVGALKRELEEATRVWEARLEGSRTALVAQEAHSAALEQELAARPSAAEVEGLKQQIRVLQAVSYNAVEGEDELEEGSGGKGGRPSSLEGMLLRKNRHLEHQVTMAKLKAAECGQQLEATATRVAELEASLQEKEQLIRQLEEDLYASRHSGGPASAAPRESSGSMGGDGSQLDLSGEKGGTEEEGVGREASMVRVLCGQRDRLRGRVAELEEEVVRVRGELAACKSQLAATQADNMALVERLRYVQGYKKGDDIEAGRAGSGAGASSSGSEVERRYMRMYEERLNPFREFQGREKEKQRKELNVVDRAMYSAGQLVFKSGAARLLAFSYLVGVHLLIFLSINRMTHHSSAALYHQQQSVVHLGRHNVTSHW